MSLIADYLLSSHVESLSSMSSRRYINMRLCEDDDYLVYWADWLLGSDHSNLLIQAVREVKMY